MAKMRPGDLEDQARAFSHPDQSVRIVAGYKGCNLIPPGTEIPEVGVTDAARAEGYHFLVRGGRGKVLEVIRITTQEVKADSPGGQKLEDFIRRVDDDKRARDEEARMRIERSSGSQGRGRGSMSGGH